MKFKKRKSNVKSGAAAGQKGEAGTLKNIERCLTSFAFLMVALIVLFMMNLPGRAARTEDDPVGRLEERLAVLEKKIAGGCPDRGERASAERKMTQGLEAVTLRCNQLEETASRRDGAMGSRMERLEHEIGTLKAQYGSLEKKKETSPDKKKTVRKKGGATTRPPKKKPVYHVIRPGETFYSISKKYGISLDQLQRLNGLTSKSLIYPGQKLLISR